MFMTCTELLIYESVTKYYLRNLYIISSDVVRLRQFRVYSIWSYRVTPLCAAALVMIQHS